MEPPKDERPRWSITWLLRIQRTGRNRRAEGPDAPNPSGRWFRWFSWGVLLLLLIEVAVGVWLGLIPR